MNQLATINAAPAFSMSDIERVALAIAKGGLFGSKDPNAVLTLCLLAQAEGQHPAVVFRDYHIINGKPAKKAEAMLRDFINAGGRIEWHVLTDECADATFSHPGGGTARIEWTIKRAQTAGINTPMWKKYPRQMLRSRTISEGVRTVFPGATSGLYEVEEVRDFAGGASEVPDAEYSEPAETPTTPTPREKMDGPFPTKTALKKAADQFIHDMRKCASLDELEHILNAPQTQALKEQLREYWPGYLNGNGMPGDYEPINAMVKRLRAEMAPADDDEPEGEEPASEPAMNPLAAG